VSALSTAALAGAMATALALHGPLQSPFQGAPSSHLLIVTGIGGEPQYAEAFHEAAATMARAARERYRVPDSNVVYLGEDPARDAKLIAGRSTKANVERAFATLARRARPDDQVWVILIGHGSSQGEESRFNLPGPDMGAADFKRLLAPLRTQKVAFVNASSASGDYVRALAGRNRAVVTATKSGLERNETVFARYFADAFASGEGADGGVGADADKNGRVSLLEAFTYARREVARHYEQENRLLTEHAQLDDDGDGVPSGDPGAAGARAKDGALAASLVLAGRGPAASGSSSDPRVAALSAERRAIEAKIDALRRRKDGMDAATYDRELEALLVDLALKTREIRAIEGGKP
jgi:hypothetical protein